MPSAITMVAAVTTAVTPPPQPLESPDECGSVGSVYTDGCLGKGYEV